MSSSSSSTTTTRRHSFTEARFDSPTWCDLCKGFVMSPFGKQGYTCSHCGTKIHSKCLPSALDLPCPSHAPPMPQPPEPPDHGHDPTGGSGGGEPIPEPPSQSQAHNYSHGDEEADAEGAADSSSSASDAGSSSILQQSAIALQQQRRCTAQQQAIYHQRQAVLDGGIGTCGLCACNNLLQRQCFTKQNFETIADFLTPDSSSSSSSSSSTPATATTATAPNSDDTPQSPAQSKLTSSGGVSSLLLSKLSSSSSSSTSQGKPVEARHKFALGLGFYDANVVIAALQMVGLTCTWHDGRNPVKGHHLICKKPTTSESPSSSNSPSSAQEACATSTPTVTFSPTLSRINLSASTLIQVPEPVPTDTLSIIGVIINVSQTVKWRGASFGATGIPLLSSIGVGLSVARHWISCRSIDDTWYVFDSMHSTPDLLGTLVEAVIFLNECIKAGATIIKVYKRTLSDGSDDSRE